MEATILSNFSKLLYINLSNTWRWLYTLNKFPGVSKRIAKHGHRQFPRPVLETSTRSSCPTYGEGKCSLRFLPTIMTDRWHLIFNINDHQMAFWQDLDSARESRTKQHQKHLWLIWSTFTTDDFWHVFGSMGFLQLGEEKFVNWKYLQSRSLFLSRWSKKQS